MQLHLRRQSHRHRGGVDYQLTLLALLSAHESDIVDANDWWEIDLYQSQHMLDLLERRQEIKYSELVPLDPELTFEERLFKMSRFEQALWKGAKLLWNSARLSRAHHITLADLVAGRQIEGDLDEVTLTEAIITKSCEILDAKLNAANSYNGGASVVGFGKPKPVIAPKLPRRLA